MTTEEKGNTMVHIEIDRSDAELVVATLDKAARLKDAMSVYHKCSGERAVADKLSAEARELQRVSAGLRIAVFNDNTAQTAAQAS